MITIDKLAAWAEHYIKDHPNDPMDPEKGYTVTQGDKIYLRRWYVIPRNDIMNVYLHEFHMSDDDRALHDHRGPNTSILLKGEYDEIQLAYGREITRRRRTGDTIRRNATDLHRIVLIDEQPVISLFSIGPTIRDWGFRCHDGKWIPWQDFVTIVPGGNELGKGCG